MAKNTNVVGKAACVAHSWLTSWGLTVEYTSKDKVAPELTVNGTHRISFNGNGDFNLDPFKVASVVLDDTLNELYQITEAMGLGKPPPTRPQDGAVRAKTENYEDVVMRTTQFKRTSNPPPEAFKPFLPVVKREAQRAFRRHYSLFNMMSYDWEDVYQIATVLAVNHYHQYMTQKWDAPTNGKFLTHYLQQQLERLAMVTAQKVRNVAFSATGTHPWDVVGAPIEGAHVEAGADGEACYTVPEEHAEEVVPVAPDASKAALEAGLAAMPHDKMVAALKGVVASEFCDFYARRLAKGKLEKHVKECVECQLK